MKRDYLQTRGEALFYEHLGHLTFLPFPKFWTTLYEYACKIEGKRKKNNIEDKHIEFILRSIFTQNLVQTAKYCSKMPLLALLFPHNNIIVGTIPARFKIHLKNATVRIRKSSNFTIDASQTVISPEFQLNSNCL